MLKEIKKTRQIPDEYSRRWFTSTKNDLIVWCDSKNKLVGFQLCYDKDKIEKSFIWKFDGFADHTAIDTGEYNAMNYKQTPVLVADGIPEHDYIKEQFLSESGLLSAEIKKMVLYALSNTNV